MGERTEVDIVVKNQDALKKLDAFQKKLLDLGKTGSKAGKDLAKGIETGLGSLNKKIANEFTRDFNKNIRETAKGSGDTFAKGFGQSMRSSLQPQLSQLRKDIEKSVSGLKTPTISTPNITPISRGGAGAFDGFKGGIVVANQALELFQKSISATQRAYAAFSETINRGIEVVNLSTAFENLQASVGRGPDALNEFRQATKGLISDLDLFRSANQAVILGVDKGSSSFLELTTNALKLGRAMGIDAKNSIDSLVIGLGRKSKLMLDNLGIIVEVEKAEQAHAQAIGKTSEQLTEAEKNLAFYNATVKAVNESASVLPELTLNAGDAFTKLTNDAENTFNEFARGIAENSNLAISLQNLGNSTSQVDFTGLAKEVAEIIAKFINMAAVITETLAPALNGLKDLLGFFNSSEGVGDLTRQFEQAGVEGLDAFRAAQASLATMDKQVLATKQEVIEFKEELGKIGDVKGVENFVLKLKDLKQLKEGELALNKTAIAASKTKQEIGFIDSALSAANSKLIGFAKNGAAAGEGNAKGLAKATKEAESFEKQLGQGIAKIKLLAKTDKDLNFLELAAQGIADAISEGTISAEDLDATLRELAAEGIKNNLSLAESLGLVGDKLKNNLDKTKETLNQEKARERQVKELQKQFQGTLVFQAGSFIDDNFSENFYSELKDAKGKVDPEKLAQALGFNLQLEQAIGSIISNAVQSGFEDFGSGQLGSSIGGTLGGLVGSIYGPIGAAIGQALGDALGKETEKSIDKFGKDTKSTIESIAFGVDTIFPGVGTAIAEGLGAIGIGKKDPYKDARSAFKELLKFFRDETKGFNFFNGVGFEGFKPNDLAALELPPSLLENYRQLGNAFAFSPELAEISQGLDGIGQQFGDILALNFENIGGLNDLQLLLQGAQVDVENFGKALEDAYFRGELTAGEFLVQNAAIQDLFVAGIPGAVGEAGLAFQNFVDNALKSGQHAQDGIADIVAEALEFGEANNINIDSVSALSSVLVNNFGRSIEEVSLLMNQLGAIGLDTIDEIANISVVDTASLVNNLVGVGFAFKDVTAGVDDTIKKIDEFKRTASQEVVTDWRIKVKVEGDKIPDEVGSQTNIKSIAAPRLQ